MIGPPLPVYDCPRISPSVMPDGRLDEAVWRTVPVAFLVDATGTQRPVPHTAVRLCWDDSHLFIRFESEDTDIWGTYTERDDPLYDEEVVEVFLCPTGDARHYFELEVSPRNVVFDAAIHNPDRDRATMATDLSWDCLGLTSHVEVSGQVHSLPPRRRANTGTHRGGYPVSPVPSGGSGTPQSASEPSSRWTAEAAIPFVSLGLDGPPDVGAEWRMNLYRIDRGDRNAFCAWSPTLKRPADFHVPDRFGTLRFVGGISGVSAGDGWSREDAMSWAARVGWLVGCNFIPSTACNQLEMWQAETFDPVTIDRELGWAGSIGMNAARVYLHDLLWEADPRGFIARIREFLRIAARHRIGIVFVLFDDCWNSDPKLGPQEPPAPGVHNSRWFQSPGERAANDVLSWPRLRRYVQGVVGALRSDRRILMWDLYNEPGNSDRGSASLPLVKAAFEWARAARPNQPLTAGVWADLPELNELQLAHSDVVTFHNYNGTEELMFHIRSLRKLGRPLVCTEWMARPGSTVATHLPIFKKEGVGCMMWGLVSGKTQTIYPWRSPGGGPEPNPWFHDLFRPDGTPYDPGETELIRRLSDRGRKQHRT